MTTPSRTPATTVPPAVRHRGPDGRFLPRPEQEAIRAEQHLNAEPTTIEPTEPAVTTAATPDDPAETETGAPEMPEDRFLNRELSWLDFNARVLALAEDPGTPLLERAKFLAIFASNLDEFYMVRVAGLKRRLKAGLPMRGGDRSSLRHQLEMITERAADLVTR